jgi:hypothetical protein
VPINKARQSEPESPCSPLPNPLSQETQKILKSHVPFHTDVATLTLNLNFQDLKNICLYLKESYSLRDSTFKNI